MTQGGGRKLINVGNYRFTGKKLGKGNFARVEEAIHTVLNVKVAVKIMDVTQIKEDYVVRNLYREARIMSKLCHPCIASLFQTMQFGNVYYLVTELVGGGDLCSFIKGQRHGRLEERFTRVYARQLVSAIAHMHNLGIVHRDLKMENVMLNSIQTQIKIVDFGLSNIFNGSTPLRTHCGSPEYAAPELFVAGRNYGPEIDLWSLGVILYGMVVGQLPFVSSREEHVSSQERRKRLLTQINKGLALPHRKALSTFSPEFRAMMSKLLIADPTKRITVKELLFHPWVTEKGRKIVRTNPIRGLNDNLQTRIFEDLTSRLHMDWEQLRLAISNDPLGNISGMYHILHHKYCLQMLNEDCVCKTLSAMTPRMQSGGQRRRDSAPAQKSYSAEQKVDKRRTEVIKSAPARGTTSSSEQGPSTSVVAAARPPSRVAANRSSTLTTAKQSSPQTTTDSTENTASITPKRMTLSSDKRRQSLLPTPRPQGATNNPPVKVRSYTHDKGARRTEAPQDASSAIPRPVGAADREDSACAVNGVRQKKVSAAMKKSSLNVEKGQTNARRSTTISRIQSAALQTRAKSEPGNRATRPVTGGPKHTAERAQKRRSALVVTTASQNITTKSVSSKEQVLSRKASTTTRKSSITWENGPHCVGDSNNNVIRSKSMHKTVKPLINDPIARCITGYLVNNVSSNIKGLKWVKTETQTNSNQCT